MSADLDSRGRKPAGSAPNPGGLAPAAINIQPYILATAGHVDHGKSAIVRALTGTDPDRLPEEKRRGITIDLGFASLQLGTYQIGIVDVPGHEDFVKNMVAGVGSIDAALLVVAADDGWMPQTEEHLQILTYLGVRHGLIALSKIDLVADEPAAIARVRERVLGTFLQDCPIVPTAATSGVGIDTLKNALADVLAHTPPPRDIGKPRLPVDRVFSLRGVGTVVTGTLVGGTLRRGDAVTVYPAGRASRIRSMQNHNRDVESAGPGSRVALNLPDLQAAEPAGAATTASVARGDVVAMPGAVATGQVIDVLLQRSARQSGAELPPLRTGARVQVHHGSAATPARARLLETDVLQAGAVSLARLTLASPLAAAVGDRLVVRDVSEQHTLAGGMIVDVVPHDRRRRRPGDLQPLHVRAAAIDDPAVFVATQIQLDAVVSRDRLGDATRFAAAEISHAIAALVDAGQLVAAGGLLIEPARWQRLRQSAAAAVDAVHRDHPDRAGLPVTELAKLALASLPRHAAETAPHLAESLAASMLAGGFVRTGAAIRRASHHISLPPRLEPAARLIRAELAAHPFDPPSRKELARTDLTQQALRFLIASGEVIDVAAEVVLSADAYGQAVERIAQHLRARGPAKVSELKELLGSSRRIMVPLLEKLDRERITRRVGDSRVLQ